MPYSSKEMTQTKRGTLVLQVGGWAWGARPHPGKKKVTETSKTPRKGSINRRRLGYREITAARSKRMEEKS
jgi:hypothetical protein